MSKIRESIKTLLENSLAVDDTYVNIYWACGGMGCQEGDPVFYVVSQSCCVDEEDEFYEEYEDVDEAITSFLRHAGIDE